MGVVHEWHHPNLRKNLPLPPSSHFAGPPSNMTSQTSTSSPSSAVCSVEYRDEFQHILILIYRIISVIKIVYCQFNAYNYVKWSTAGVPKCSSDIRGVGNMNLAVCCAFSQMWRVWRHSFLAPLSYVTRRHNNVKCKPLSSSEHDVIFGRPHGHSESLNLRQRYVTLFF